MTWFNAHCHLELSFLKGVIRPGLSFVEWLRGVIVARRGLQNPEVKQNAEQVALQTLQRVVASGTSILYDIDSLGFELRCPDGMTHLRRYKELICFRPEEARALLARHHTSLVLSPHSPYTVCEALLLGLVPLQKGRRLCIHAAETREEVDFLVTGTGELRALFEELGVLPPGWKPMGLPPVEYLQRLNLLGPQTLLVHCNHLKDSEVQLLAKTNTPVVVCPGTHVYFDRGEFPLRRLKDAGVRVYLGTDSLASNEELEMEREARLAAELSPGVPLDWILDRIRVERAAELH
jgi:cytosine/adenosine deaminase-related metal-dependent hydrolase